MERYLEWGAFAVLTAIALLATFRLYVTVSRAIEIWFSEDFVPVFQAAFNFLVLVVAAIGLSLLVRRRRKGHRGTGTGS